MNAHTTTFEHPTRIIDTRHASDASYERAVSRNGSRACFQFSPMVASIKRRSSDIRCALLTTSLGAIFDILSVNSGIFAKDAGKRHIRRNAGAQGGRDNGRTARRMVHLPRDYSQESPSELRVRRQVVGLGLAVLEQSVARRLPSMTIGPEGTMMGRRRPVSGAVFTGRVALTPR